MGRFSIAALALLGALPGWAQDAGSATFRDRVRQALERQKSSVQRQSGAAHRSVESAVAKQRTAVESQLLAARPEPKPFLAFERITLPAPVMTPAFDCQPTSRAEIDSIISEAAREYDLGANLLRTVIKHESAFNPCAVSHKGALGLMQLMPGTALDMGVRNPFDAEQNIYGGAQYLSGMLSSFNGDLGRALAAYNAGPAAVRKYDGTPPYAETQSYVASILRTLGVKGASD